MSDVKHRIIFSSCGNNFVVLLKIVAVEGKIICR